MKTQKAYMYIFACKYSDMYNHTHENTHTHTYTHIHTHTHTHTHTHAHTHTHTRTHARTHTNTSKTHLNSHPALVRDKTVLELGSGTGLLGCIAAALCPHQVTFFHFSINWVVGIGRFCSQKYFISSRIAFVMS